MKLIEINTVEELAKFDLKNIEVNEDIDIKIKLRVIDQEIDYPINIYHSQIGKNSKISIKIALFGKSKANIPVGIYVNAGAKNTSTNFSAKVYLLSKNARANVTPGLFIHEKDILSAAHGVVIKNIKDEDLIYLRSRGVEKSISREMVIGFWENGRDELVIAD